MGFVVWSNGFWSKFYHELYLVQLAQFTKQFWSIQTRFLSKETKLKALSWIHNKYAPNSDGAEMSKTVTDSSNNFRYTLHMGVCLEDQIKPSSM